MPQSISSLPVGTLVKFGSIYGNKITWVIVDQNHQGYTSGSTTLVSDKIIKSMPYDAAEPANGDTNRRYGGNNRYKYSNIRQWLNSQDGAGAWYSAQYSADMGPDKSYVETDPYLYEAGFLSEWNAHDISAIMETSHKVVAAQQDGGSEYVTDKIFLPALSEYGAQDPGSTPVGITYSYFKTYRNKLRAVMTADCANHAQNNDLYTPVTGAAVPYWTSSAYYNGVSNVNVVDTNYSYMNTTRTAMYAAGLRPAVNVYSTTQVTDSTDSDGAYTVIINDPPTNTGTITVPETIEGGQTYSVTWGRATDPDGNLAGYILEENVDGTKWTQVYKGAFRGARCSVPYGTSNVTYRVKAYDTYNAMSGYVQSNTIAVHNNRPPVITLNSTDLGQLTNSPFSLTYSVTDADNDSVTVTEAVDGTVYNTVTPSLGANTTFTMTTTDWQKILNGSHTITITATDPHGSTASADCVFSKKVTKIVVTKKSAVTVDEQPKKIIVNIQGKFPTGSTLKVEACNNANDTAPTYEDITEAVNAGKVYAFTNTAKTADKWGVKVRVTVDRGTATGDVYLSAIGGNFE